MAHLVLYDFSCSGLDSAVPTNSHTKFNMKTFIVFAALVAVALAGVPHRRQAFSTPTSNLDVQVVNEIMSDNIGLDGYKFGYELSDGQKRDESAQVEARANPEESVLRVTGSFSFVGDDGQTYTITYVADENGFQPQGAHIPVAPVA